MAIFIFFLLISPLPRSSLNISIHFTYSLHFNYLLHPLLLQDGSDLGWEEYYDYNFPDDEKKVMGFKILENAMKWKQAAAAAALEGTY